MARGMMGNSLSQTTEATTERKEEEILVRGQSKHKWNWKFRESERERLPSMWVSQKIKPKIL